MQSVPGWKKGEQILVFSLLFPPDLDPTPEQDLNKIRGQSLVVRPSDSFGRGHVRGLPADAVDHPSPLNREKEIDMATVLDLDCISTFSDFDLMKDC